MPLRGSVAPRAALWPLRVQNTSDLQSPLARGYSSDGVPICVICCDEASALRRGRPIQNCAADAGVTGTAPDTPLHAVLRRSSPRRRHIPARAAGGGGGGGPAQSRRSPCPGSSPALVLWDGQSACRDPAPPDATREQKRDLSCLVTKRSAGRVERRQRIFCSLGTREACT